VETALDGPVGGVKLSDFHGVRSAAIAITDKTRPVPMNILLPALLRRLEDIDLGPEDIKLLIGTGTHPTMLPEEYHLVIPEQLLARHPILGHNSDDPDLLVHKGVTAQGTPVWVNRHFAEADLRIVVGNIESHQFMGFSGGVKSAAIGLAGRDTINHNHAMMTDPRAQLARYEDNPPRQDLEEVGRLMGIHFALNGVVNWENELVDAFAGEPRAVMEAGIPTCRQAWQMPVENRFDLTIASPGGHPKDGCLYQAQKGLLRATMATHAGGTVILAAACSEGIGSKDYERYVEGMHSHKEVLARLEQEVIAVGPHKAWQIARDASHAQVILVSEMEPDLVRSLLLTPAASVDDAIAMVASELAQGAQVGIMPRASSTIPTVGQTTA
jgi:nickel-dependent lactate racemase